MTTALQIINGATEEVGVKTAENALEAADYQVALDRMNDMLSEWADTGLTPAFVTVSNTTDTVHIDRNAVGAAKYNLAMRIAPAFQRVVTPMLRELARDTLNALETSAVHIGPVALPDTLPTGSGNDCLTDTRFFDQNKVENF